MLVSKAANQRIFPAQGRFLDATGLKSSWPAEGPDVFLGSWCFRFPEDEVLAQHAKVVTYPWVSAEARIRGWEFCDELTRRISLGLAPLFSTLLGDEVDGRSAILLLSPTAARLIGAAYHLFVCLETATPMATAAGSSMWTATNMSTSSTP